MKRLLLLTTLAAAAACGPQSAETCLSHDDCAAGEVCADGACVPGPCAGVSCSGKGVCSAPEGAPRCACEAGFVAAGLECVPETADLCAGVSCSGHGSCRVEGGVARCVCESGFAAQGLACVAVEDPCAAVSCSGHGSCRVEAGVAACVCEAGFLAQGLSCVADPCFEEDCSGHGSCRVEGGAAGCACEPGYLAQGLACVVDVCFEEECSGHGSCVASGANPTCSCDAGWEANGLECEPAGPAPVASFTLSATGATVRDPLELDASGSTGTTLKYRWDFEDDAILDTAWASSATLRHRWHQPAGYTVRLEVEDAAGRTASATRTLAVSAAAGTPTWVGISNNTPGEYGWWTVTDLDGNKLSDTEVKTTDEHSYTKVRSAKQASDGRVVIAVECLSTLTCLQSELAVVGTGGKSGVLAAFTPDFAPTDLLELPNGHWIVSGRAQGAIIELDANGAPLGYWAQSLQGPAGLALADDGRAVLVAQADAGRIDRFSLDGRLLGRWDAVGSVATPYTMRRAASGRYLVADLGGRVLEFEPDGSVAATLLESPDLQVPRGLAELPDGRLLVGEDCSTSDDRCGLVLAYDRNTGTISRFTPPSGVEWVIDNPDGIIAPVP